MKIHCNETENLIKVEKLYNEIIEIKSNLIKYLNAFNNSTKEYLKQLKQIENNYGYYLQNYEKNKDYDINEIINVTKNIPTVIKEKIQSYSFVTELLTESINKMKYIFEENEQIINNINLDYIDSKNDLELKYQNIEKLKRNFFLKANEAENFLIDLTLTKKKCKQKKLNAEQEKIINQLLHEMEMAENEYISPVESIKHMEDSFLSSIESCLNSKKVIIISNINAIKDTVQHFLVNIKNSYKMCYNEETQEKKLRELNQLKLGDKLNEIMEKNKIINKPFIKFQILPYKMKILNKQQTKNCSSDLLNNLPINELDDNDIYEIANKIYKKLNLKYPNYNLEIEKEKLLTNKISNKILSFINKNNKLESPSKEELKQINKLMDSKFNRKIFIQKLNEFRNSGIFVIPEEIFNEIGEIFNSMLNKVRDDNDFYCAKNCIILSQTFYINIDENKIYLYTKIKNNPLFKSKLFWDKFIKYSIDIGISYSSNVNINNTSYSSEVIEPIKYDNIVFGQLIPLTDNMIEFGLDKDVIQELIIPIIQKYNLSEESKNLILDILKSKKE
jgi:hypothetical protein